MKILITGSSGFLGKILCQKLEKNHEIVKLSSSEMTGLQLDIKNALPALPYFDLVIHAAGKAHSIPKKESDESEFFEVNVNGTKNLLESLKLNPPKQFIFISSVAVYGIENGENINETYPLLGTTPYAKSKILAEELVVRWGELNNVNVLVFRLPLIVGFNPPGNLGKMIVAIKNGRYFTFGDGNARKSMVLAENIGDFIRTLDFSLSGTYNITDGYHPRFNEIESLICMQLGKKSPIRIPKVFGSFFGKFGDFFPFFPINTNLINKLTKDLTFDDTYARTQIGWSSDIVLEKLVVNNLKNSE